GRLLQRIEQQRAADRVRTARDRRDRRGVEAEVLNALRELSLDRGDGFTDIAGLELGQLFAICLDRVRQRVQQAGALGRRGLAPVAGKRSLRGRYGAIDVLLSSRGDAGERLAGRRLAQLTRLARGRLRTLAVDEEPFPA